MKIPVTTCELMDTPERRVFDLSCEGVPEIPVLGMNRSVRASEGSFFHRHDGCMEITYCDRGSVKFDCGGRAYSLLPGGVFASKPTDVHRLRMNPKGARLLWIFLRLPKAGEPFFCLPSDEAHWLLSRVKAFPRKSFAGTEEVRSAFLKLFAVHDTARKDTAARRLKLRMGALALVMALAEAGHADAPAADDSRFRALVDRMRREPQRAYPMDELAREMRCSPNTVLARFRSFTGLPPQSFLMKCRIRRAEELLQDPSRRVTDIAEMLGFASSQHFATRFKQETGRSPRAFRQDVH